MRFKRRKLLPQTNLLDLPNCLILQLLSYLDATSLYLLSSTCERLDDLVKEHTSLWRYIDARRSPNDREKVSYCISRGHDETRTFLIRADNPSEMIIPEEFFTRINALKNLTVLAMENQTVDGVRYTMTSFPEGLQELSLKKSNITNAMEFFRFSGEHMKNLRVLILDGCDWVSSCAFMPISKYKNLEILSVYKCKNIDNCIPYLSLSGKYGFKNLKIFDVRLSPLGNTLLRSLYKSGSLLAIYLQNEDISYKLDYFKRKLHILKGAPSRDFYIEDKEFDLDDSLMNEEDGLNYEDPNALDDKGLQDYLWTTSEQNKTNLPKSFLYTDPYNSCTCGYEDHHNGKRKIYDDNNKLDSSDSDDDDDDDAPHKNLKDATIRELEEKVDRLTDMVHRSQVSNGWSRGLNPSAEETANGIPCNFSNRSVLENLQEEIDEFVRKERDYYYRFLLSCKREETSKAPLTNHKIIEVHLNPVREEEPRKRPHEDEGEPDMKKQRRIEGEEPSAGPSGLNNHESEDSEDERPEPPVPEDVPEPLRMDFDIVRFENVNNVAKENVIPLKRLSLRGYKKITDVVLYYIKDLDLDLLDLTYTNVTVDGINNYLVDHPSCRIVHEKFCVCPTNLHF